MQNNTAVVKAESNAKSKGLGIFTGILAKVETLLKKVYDHWILMEFILLGVTLFGGIGFVIAKPNFYLVLVNLKKGE